MLGQEGTGIPDTVTDQVERLLERRRLVSTLVLFSVAAAGVTLVASAVLEPQWAVILFLDHVPGLVMGTIRWLKVRPKTAVALYGAILSVGALGVFGIVEWRARADVRRYTQLREPVLLRFLITAGFVAGFIGARAVVVLGGLATTQGALTAGIGLFQQLWIFGFHIHHFFIGFLLVMLAGWGALLHPQISRRWLAVLYGIGAGVFMDEVGFLLTWGDYYARQSWFVAVTFLSVLVAAMLWVWGTSPAIEEQGP